MEGYNTQYMTQHFLVGMLQTTGRLLSGLLLLCLGLAGCAPASLAPRGAIDGVVAAVPAGSAAQALQAAARQYTAETGTTIRVDVIAADAYFDRASAVLLSGLDRYDLLYLPADTLPRWVQYHALRPITADVDGEPLAPWLPALTFSQDGAEQLFALPVQPDPLLLWYRADLQSAAGLPGPSTGLEAFRANARALNAPPDHYAVAIAGGELDAGLDYAALLAGAPGDLLNAFTSVEGESTARQALTLYAALREEGLADPTSDQAARGDVINALREGRAAMGFAPLSAGADLLDCEISPLACAEGKPLLKAAPLPGEGCAVISSLSVWAVPLRAANPEAAGLFAAWLASEEGARAWSAGGGMPAHTTVLQDLPEGKHALLPEEIAPILGRAECYEHIFLKHPNGDVLWNALHRSAHAAVAGEQSPETAYERAAEDIRQGLRQEGAGR